MVTSGWGLIEHILLRRAGFPLSLLTAAATPVVSTAARRAAHHAAEADRHRRDLLSDAFPKAVAAAQESRDRAALRALSRWRREVGRRHLVDAPAGNWPEPLERAHAAYANALTRLRAAHAEVEAHVAVEVAAAGDALREKATDERIREAVLLLSPDAHDMIAGSGPLGAGVRRTARERSRDRLMYRYVQRLAAKNETTSFFGPLTYMTVAPADQAHHGPEAPGGVVRREVFAAFWAVAAIAGRAARDPALRPHLPVRRLPLGSAPDDDILGWVDGVRTTAEIADATGLAVEEVDTRLDDLERLRLVRRDLEPLSTTPAPLEDVAARLPDVPGATRWQEAIDEFRGHLAAFSTASYERRRVVLTAAEDWFSTVTGRPARRGGGKMYADRGILYEECLGDSHPFVLPAREAERLVAQLTPALNLCATYGRLRHEGLRQLASDVLAQQGDRMPFLTFVDVMAVAAGSVGQYFAETDAWLVELTARVSAASDGHRALLEASSLADMVEPGSAPRFVSPDVLLDRVEGEVRPVIGELHPYVAAWGSQGLLAPDPGSFHEAFRRDLTPWGGSERLCTVLRRRRHKGLVTEAFPGRFIEVSGLASHDARRCIAIDSLAVTAGPDGPQLLVDDVPVTLYCGEDDHAHLQVFAPPQVVVPTVQLGDHTPRIEIDEVVLRRERWVLPAPLRAQLAGATAAEGLVMVARERLRHGWPRHCFAHSSSEPKPLYLDLDSALAVDVLRGLGAATDVTLVEMVPTPERSWLRRSDGPYTSELRLALVRP